MRFSSSLALFLLLCPAISLASPEALRAARIAVETGGAEEVFFALEAAPPKDAQEKRAYANLLVEAAELLLAVDDSVFALQLSKKALSHDPDRLDARLLCLQAALEASSLDEADSHLRLLEKARPNDPNVVLWRARLAAADAEWETAKASAKRVSRMKGATVEQKKEAKTLARRAVVATEGEKKKLAALSAAERKQAKRRQAVAKAQKTQPSESAPKKAAGADFARDTIPEAKSGWSGIGPHLVLYCDGSRLCMRARSRLKHHGVTFSERAVHKSGMAADELEEHGFTKHSVPVYVMHDEATRSLSKALSTLRSRGVLR